MRVLLLFVVLTIALGMGKVIYDEQLQKQVFSRHNHLIKTARVLLHEHLMKAVQDTHQLSIISCTKKYLDAPTPESHQTLERILIDTANVYGRYSHIRILNLDGKELIRVNHTPVGAVGVPSEFLQSKSESDYIKEGLKLKPGQVYLSPVELNREFGLLEKPLNPTLRLVRMLANSEGEPTALLVLNYKARGMLNQFIKQFPQADRAMLLNSAGYWLANHNTSMEWGWLLGRPSLTLKQWNPGLWEAIESHQSGVFNRDDDLFTFQRVDIANIYHNTSHAYDIRDLGLVSDLKAVIWTIVVKTTQADWQKQAIYNSFWFRFILISFIITLVWVMYLLARNQYQRQLNIQLQHKQLNSFKDLYENAPIGYITLSTEGVITNVNKVLLGYLGYERNEIVNCLHLSDLVDDNSLTEVERLLLTLVDGQERYSRIKMRRTDGHLIDVRCNLSLRTQENMDLPVGRCSVQDISDRIQLEQQLEDLSRQDPLTGIGNRRYFDERAEVELNRARRTATPLSAIALDIDYFKRINDTYGHAVGDEVLKEVAQQLQSRLRSTDVLARVGGEEFMILLPDTALEQAVEKAESMRKSLAELTVVLSTGVSIQFTASFGVAALGQHGVSIQQLLEAADEALYEAKRSGRNCVKVAF